LLIVRAAEQTLALVVDQVEQVLSVPVGEVQAPAQPLSRSRPLSAVIRRDDELIIVLDAARLLPAEAEGWRASPESAATWGDDLTQITGIGPAYAARLRATGVLSLAALAKGEAAAIAARIGLPAGRTDAVQRWIDEAASRLQGPGTGAHP
jgi:predicted flap endonuclease-1-like 5' DNA nuclease